MIGSIRHRGLRRLYEADETRGVRQDQVRRLRRILTALDSAERIEEIVELPGLRAHPLRGDYRGFWSVTVSGNWRVVFRFEAGTASEVDLVDYH